MIPIQNLYYLLCYAWDFAEQADLVEIKDLEPHRVNDLLARVLIAGVDDLLRRGLDQGYREIDEEVRGIRGRIDFQITTSRLLMKHGRTHCRFDPLTHDVLHNRLLKATMVRLARAEDLDDRHRSGLRDHLTRFRAITDVRLDPAGFRRVTIHRNNRVYDFLMNVCRLVAQSTLPESGDSEARFPDFRTEEGMGLLFERFIRRFYEREQSKYSVSAPSFKWQEVTGSPDDLSFLPRLETDVVLRSPNRVILIETKFYEKVLLRSRRSERETLRPDHVRQLHAYLQNLRIKDRDHAPTEAVLLYAENERPMDLRYTFQGLPVRVKTLRLDQDWPEIEADLLKLVDAPSTRLPTAGTTHLSQTG